MKVDTKVIITVGLYKGTKGTVVLVNEQNPSIITVLTEDGRYVAKTVEWVEEI